MNITSGQAQAPIVVASRLRLTRRGRVVLTSLAAAPLVIAAMLFALNGGSATATAHGSVSQQFVTVQDGDSLWQVAEAIDPNGDTREAVAQLIVFNDLPSADVFAGQTLAVPAQYSLD